MRKKIYSGVAGTIITAIIAVAVSVFTPVDTLELKLNAPSQIGIGRIAVLDASETGADSYAWVISPASEALIFENGQKLAFAHFKPGKYLFILAAAKDGKVGIIEHVIEVVGSAPDNPDSFESRLKTWFDQVQSQNKTAEAVSLSNSFSSVASIIAAGAISEPEEIIKATVQMNREALGKNAQAWDPFFQGLRKELNDRSQAGTLVTKEDHIKIWREIAALLQKYAR